MKSLIKKYSIHALGYERFLMCVFWMRRLQQFVLRGRNEFVVLASLVQPNTSILDIGANIGYVAAVLATVPGSHVYCFEPDDDNFACLRRTVGRRPNVTLHRVAIGSADGVAILQAVFEKGIKQHALSRLRSDTQPHGSDQQVLVRSVDSLRASMNGHIGLIKIDVEGSECDVLEGMLATVCSTRPYIHAEICGNVSISRYGAFCASNKYEPYRWVSRKFRRAEAIVRGGNYLLVPQERAEDIHGRVLSIGTQDSQVIKTQTRFAFACN